MTNDLKGYQWWQEEIILLWENQIIILIIRSGNNLNYLCRWCKIFFSKACIKEGNVLTFLILGPILDHIFGPKLFCPVFIFRRSMLNAICNLVVYLQSEGLNISWTYPGTIPFQYLKTVFAIQYSTLSLTGSQFIFLKCDGSIWDLRGKFRQEWLHLFWAFWSLSFKFSLKEKTMKNVHNQNVAELAHDMIVFYTHGLGTCFGHTGIWV